MYSLLMNELGAMLSIIIWAALACSGSLGSFVTWNSESRGTAKDDNELPRLPFTPY